MNLKVIGHRVVYTSRDYGHSYCSFPSAAITLDGEILVSFRRARHFGAAYTHIDPISHAVLLRSRDLGRTFEESILHAERFEGIQDPGLNLLSDGTLLATFFTWSVQARAYTTDPDGPDALWRELDADHVARLGGLYTIRSHDQGATWDERILVGDGRYGLRGKGVELPDGTFLLAAYRPPYTTGGGVSILSTKNQGQHWEILAEIPESKPFNETHLFQTRGGKIIAFMRSTEWNAERPEISPLHTSESLDGGKTWDIPIARPFFGPTPFDAMKLRSGNVLVSYGYRFAPFGIRAFLLDGECRYWDGIKETALRADGLGRDIGYTSAIQLPNDDILIFYYFYGKDDYRHIAVTTCRES